MDHTNFDRRNLLAGAIAGGLLAGATSSAALQAQEKESSTSARSAFQLGLVTYNIAAKWNLKTILEVCKKTGIAAVECRTTHAHGVEPKLTANERTAIRKQFQDSGIVFWGSGSTCEFHANDPTVVQKNIEDCKKFVQLVADLGGKGVKVRPNALVKGVPKEKTLEQIGKSLIDCGKAASDAGVEIWVEVHGKDTQDPENMKVIMETCNHPAVGVTWNSNPNPAEVKNGSIKQSFDLLSKWIKSVHINDLWKDHQKVYPYRELFSLLTQLGYNRYTLIELGYTPPDVAAGEQLLRFYKALWLELCQPVK
ncbi:MAG: TIM barrel protein [Zavarzinella sp.]